jgi:hypothetical protein
MYVRQDRVCDVSYVKRTRAHATPCRIPVSQFVDGKVAFSFRKLPVGNGHEGEVEKFLGFKLVVHILCGKGSTPDRRANYRPRDLPDTYSSLEAERRRCRRYWESHRDGLDPNQRHDRGCDTTPISSYTAHPFRLSNDLDLEATTSKAVAHRLRRCHPPVHAQLHDLVMEFRHLVLEPSRIVFSMGVA